jgi:hypothetical protein
MLRDYALYCMAALLAAPAAQAAPKLGRWGEDLTLTPDFAPTEERRAPKFPDVQKRLAELGESHVDGLDQGLLLCHAQIAGDGFLSLGLGQPGPRWDTFGGPDTRFRLTVGTAHPIELWGPEDHWDSYVSIPRLTLHRADKLRLDVWDRDVTTDEKIGQTELRWQGDLPIVFRGRWFQVTCNAVDAARATQLAAPMLQTIDRKLDEMEQLKPDPRREAMGDFETGERGLEGHFKDSWFGKVRLYPLRYAAGALGWESPEIQARIERLRGARSGWHRRCQAAVEGLVGAGPPPGPWVPLLGGEVRVASMICGARVRAQLGRGAPTVRSDCAVELELRSPPRDAGASQGCFGAGQVVAEAWRADGTWSAASSSVRAGRRGLVPCDGAEPAQKVVWTVSQHLGTPSLDELTSRAGPLPPPPRLLRLYVAGTGADPVWLVLPGATEPSSPSERPAESPAPAPRDTAGTPTPDR